MGNLASANNGEGGSFALVEAVAKASQEAGNRAAALQMNHFSRIHNYDDDDDDDGDDINSFDNMKTRHCCDEAGDPKRPWLISTRDVLEKEEKENDLIKKSCIANYPGNCSSYINKLKWAEQNSRVHYSKNDDIGPILRGIVFDKSPEKILLQVLIRKPSLKHLYDDEKANNDDDDDDDDDNMMNNSNIFSSVYQQTQQDLRFLLREDYPDSELKSKDDFSQYINWLYQKAASGTVLSTKKQPSPSSSSNSSSPNNAGNKNGQLICLLNIQADKHLPLSNIIDRLHKSLMIKSDCRIESIGPPVLPPQFITTFLKIDDEEKLGCLPVFPSAIHGKDVYCAAVELMISNVVTSTKMTTTTSNLLRQQQQHCGMRRLYALSDISPLRNNNIITTPLPSSSSCNDESSQQQTTPVAAHLIQAASSSKLKRDLLEMEHLKPEKTFIMVDNCPKRKRRRRQRQCATFDDNRGPKKEPSSSTPVLWLSSFFRHALTRTKSHCLHGRGEAIDIRRRLCHSRSRRRRLGQQSSNDDDDDDNLAAVDEFQCRFELFESNLNNLIENRNGLTTPKLFCELLALTLVVTFCDDDDSEDENESGNGNISNSRSRSSSSGSGGSSSSLDKSWVKDVVEDCDHIIDFFGDLGTFWKSILKKSDRQLDLGFDSASEQQQLQLQLQKTMGVVVVDYSASRRALITLLSHLEDVMNDKYNDFLDDGSDDAILDLGFSSSSTTASSLSLNGGGGGNLSHCNNDDDDYETRKRKRQHDGSRDAVDDIVEQPSKK